MSPAGRSHYLQGAPIPCGYPLWEFEVCSQRLSQLLRCPYNLLKRSNMDGPTLRKKTRTRTQVAHITIPPKMRERLERSSEGAYRTLNMQVQYLVASSLQREPVLPEHEDTSLNISPDGVNCRLPLRFDKDLYDLITASAAARSASISAEVRTRLELAMNVEDARAENWAELENQINAVLQSGCLNSLQQSALSEKLAQCQLDSHNDKTTPFSTLSIQWRIP